MTPQCPTCGKKMTPTYSEGPPFKKENQVGWSCDNCEPCDLQESKEPQQPKKLAYSHLCERCGSLIPHKNAGHLCYASKEDTECTCSSRLAADPGKWPSRSGIHEEKCPLHGEPKQEYLDERTLEDILREMLSGEHDSRYAQEEIKSLFNAWHTQKLREVRNTVAKRIKSCPEEDFGKTDAIVYLDSAIDRALKETE